MEDDVDDEMEIDEEGVEGVVVTVVVVEGWVGREEEEVILISFGVSFVSFTGFSTDFWVVEGMLTVGLGVAGRVEQDLRQIFPAEAIGDEECFLISPDLSREEGVGV